MSIGAKSIAIKLVDDNVSTTGANKIEGMSGYGVAGGKDSFEISSGFFIDNPGNVSTSTADVRWKIPTITATQITLRLLTLLHLKARIWTCWLIIMSLTRIGINLECGWVICAKLASSDIVYY